MPRTPIDLVALVVALVLLPVNGFNIDLKKSLTITGPKDSHFGLSSTFVPEPGSNQITMKVGASKYKTTPDGPKTGAVFHCSNVLSPNTPQCQTPPVYIPDGKNFPGASEGEGFGTSLSVTGANTMVMCSPQWKDTKFASSNYFTFLIGRCSVKNQTTTSQVSPFNEPAKYNVMLDKAREFLYGHAMFGFSSDTDGGSVHVLGAPGIMMFEGNVYIMDLQSMKNATVPIVTDNKINSTAYGYTGYSVKLGKFCDGTGICLAAGAPNMRRFGTVFLLQWRSKDDKYLDTIYSLEGEQAWSMFGYSLCAVDVDADGYDELLVGAPHYTVMERAVDGQDQGRVFVYSRSASSQKLEQKSTLEGTKKRFARFGTAVGRVGDINLDGYQDVAVGAPGEDDDAGAVYIYLGTKSGFSNPAQQRITPSQINSPVKGFGFSFSNNWATPAGQRYPVFAVSSVADSKLIILQCRTVVNVTSSLRTEPDIVDSNETSCSDVTEPCFSLSFCLRYSLIGGSPQILNFTVRVLVDPQVKAIYQKRALVVDTLGKLNDTYTTHISSGCHTMSVVLQEMPLHQDRFTPLELVAQYDVISATPGTGPVMDVLQPNSVRTTVAFQNECGSDNKCQVDLVTTGSLEFFPATSSNSLVVNLTDELIVKVKVSNLKETAYWTVVRVEVSSTLYFLKAKSDGSCDRVAHTSADPGTNATAAGEMRDTVVICNYYKPLAKDDVIPFSVSFHPEQLDLSRSDLEVKVTAMPKNQQHNPEQTPADNTVSLAAQLEIVPDLSLDSSSSPSAYTVYEAKGSQSDSDGRTVPLNVSHKVLITNRGPSFLPATSITISVPVLLTDRSKIVLQANVRLSGPDGEVTSCTAVGNINILHSSTTTTSTSSTTVTSSAPANGSTTKPSQAPQTTASLTTAETTIDFGVHGNRRKRAADSSGEKTYVISCERDPALCVQFKCDLQTPIQPKKHVEINISLVLNQANLPFPEDSNTLVLTTDLQVARPPHHLLKSWDDKTLKTSTKFHLVQSGGKVNIWIIIGCIAAGLVLIAIIVVVLWKLGFFKRKKHQEVEKWKRESIRRSKKGYSKAETNDGPGEGTAEGAAATAASKTTDGDL